MLSGYKTYIVGAIMALMVILYGIDIIPVEAFITIAGVLLGGGVITTRAAISKVNKAVANPEK